MAIDFLKMRYFAKIAELGSFTKASEELGVAQPALSLHIRVLEEQMGVQLLNRTSRGVVMTEAGKTLFAHAQAILRAIEQAETETRERAEFPSGDVSLGVLSSICPILAVPVIERCHRQFPRIRLTVSEGDSQALRIGIDTRLFDLAVTLEEVAKPPFIPLFEERLFVVGPTGHFSACTEIAIVEALDLPLILPTRRHGIRILLERQALILGRDLNIVREIEGVSTTKAAIRAGLGLTILGKGAASLYPTDEGLSAIPLGPTPLTRRLVLDMPSNHPTKKATDEVRHILLGVVAELAGHDHWTLSGKTKGNSEFQNLPGSV